MITPQINNDMEENMQSLNKTSEEMHTPDENGGVYVQGHIKIFDPETNEIFIEARA